MKRSLQVVDEIRDPPVWTPIAVRIRGELVSVVDTGDGMASRRFVEALLAEGATPGEEDGSAPPTLRIVIRGATSSAEARLRADVLEEAADLVLGAARPAFAKLFAATIAHD